MEREVTESRHPATVETSQRLDRMRDEIFRLGLERNIVELELYGYTVVQDAKPLAFFDELRDTILALNEEDRVSGRRIPLSGPNGNSFLITWLLARGRIFEEAVMAEKPLALITYLMGESCQISSNHAHIRGEGDPPQGMHTDAPLMPEPLPDFPVASNMMWVMDDFSRESGGTLVIPGSHKKRVHPSPGTIKMAVPISAPKGSVIVFNGNLWHSAGARSLPGVRVGMTIYFTRMYARPQEDLNAVISDEVVARNPPRFAHLIGRNNPYPARDFDFFNPRGAKYFGPTRDGRG
ncbi:MAG: phytanoyl-CoA dioxygenase family protein [Pseudomonadota bacterium]